MVDVRDPNMGNSPLKQILEKFKNLRIFYFLYFFNFYLMCIGILTACMSG